MQETGKEILPSLPSSCDDAGAEAAFCTLGGGFPGDADLREKAAAGGAGFGEEFVAAVSVVADTGGD